MTARIETIERIAPDGHRWQLIAHRPAQAVAQLLWLPALGVAARHYQAFAEALAAHGIAVLLHEWRGNGSSSLRPSRQLDWGYRELLTQDLPASLESLDATDGDGPRLLGGHSLGGQLACCLAALQPHRVDRLCLVATGTPYWRSFPPPLRAALPLVYRFLPWLAQVHGTLPGRRLGFGGTEARGLIDDWARVGLSNRYAAAGTSLALEAALGELACPIEAWVLDQDRFAPLGSMRALLAKMPRSEARVATLDAAQLGTRADHFAWMKAPTALAAALAQGVTAAGCSQKR